MLLMIGGGWVCMVSGLGWGDGGRGRWCCSRYLFETILGVFFGFCGSIPCSVCNFTSKYA